MATENSNFIFIEDLLVEAKHGVKDFEKENAQPFLFSAKLYLDFFQAAKYDDLTETVNYSDVCKLLTAFTVNNCFDLIETLADRAAELLLHTYEKLNRVELTVKKPKAPVKLPFGCISVTVDKSWHTSYLSMGSNMGDRKYYLDFAICELGKECKINAVSDTIETEPYGGIAKGKFLNIVLEVKTLLSENELLDLISDIEKQAGRVRDVKWGDRTLDIDILLYDDKILNSKDLTLPHPEMRNRLFVLEPLIQIAPHLADPKTNEKYSKILSKLKK